METRIVLIEAGPTPWDTEGRLVGSASLPLTAEAMDAIRHLLDTLPGSIDSLYYPPDNESCSQAARLIAHKYGIRARKNHDLEELRLGLWEGLHPAKVRGRFPTVFPEWEEHPLGITPPDGEPLEAGIARLRAALHKITRKKRNLSVALPLRPMAMQIASGLLHGQSIAEIAARLRQRQPMETIELDPAALKSLLE